MDGTFMTQQSHGQLYRWKAKKKKFESRAGSF